MVNSQTALAQLEAAAAEKRLSPGAVENIRTWLTEPYLEEYAPQVIAHLAGGMWKQLDDVFWTAIPFGTGGRRGKMHPIGSNAINDRTIGETAQGLADYVKQQVKDKPLRCAVAYDTRHRSRHFAELCSQIMAAAGFTVYFLDGYRSTPELSFAVRHKECACGIMITASHNPPADNAVKVYWAGGGQLLPPHDAGAIEQMRRVTWIKQIGFAQGLESGKIVYCQQEVDAAYVEAVLAQSVAGPRELKIIYSPLHGVGASAVCPVLEAAGFKDVELFSLHATPDPEFSNVPGHSANPENAAVFDVIIERAEQVGAELILATDPDCDRLGCAVPAAWRGEGPGAGARGEGLDAAEREEGKAEGAEAPAPRPPAPGPSPPAPGPWTTLTGNQIGALLTDFLLKVQQAAGTLTADHYVVKTLVTTELIRRIADSYGVQTAGNLLVGFKWIGAEIDRRGAEQFVFGAEESYGFLAGRHARDKDAAVAAMLLAELAARLKAQRMTLAEKLDELFRRYGCHAEKTISTQMPGEKGMDQMKALMAAFRSRPPESLGGLLIRRTRDYLMGTLTETGGRPQPLDGPQGDMVIFDLQAEGNYVAVRPSGTEPKVKFYMFAYDPPESSTDLPSTKAAQADRLAAMERDLRAFSEQEAG